MLRLAEGFIARGFGVDFVVEEAKGELLGEVPPSAPIVELDRVRLWRGRACGFAADPGSWGLLLQPRSRISLLKPLLRRLPSMVDYLRSARPDAVLAAEPRFQPVRRLGPKPEPLEQPLGDQRAQSSVPSRDHGWSVG